MQHIGELFVYLDKSVRPEGMLGFIIDKTWVINFKLKILAHGDKVEVSFCYAIPSALAMVSRPV